MTVLARCVAHGDRLCRACSRTLPGGLDEHGHCRGCATYIDSGMHWDTCPHRDTSPVVATPARVSVGFEDLDVAELARRIEWSPCCPPGQQPEVLIVQQLLRLVDAELRARGQTRGLMMRALRDCGRECMRLKAENAALREARFDCG